jgi:short-subunit dehydrogenase
MKRYTEKAILKRPLQEKTVVITGASSGVGKAAALAFAAQGTTLVLAARREHALGDVVKECHQLGAAAIAVGTDVTIADEMKRLAKTAIDFGRSVDVWINNAGVLAAGSFTETPVEIHDRAIETNLIGYLHGAYAVLPYFKQQQYGVLINNISVGGWIPTPYAVGYTASKYGLRGFSEALRAELSRWPDIHVCDLYPAFLDTPGIQHAANYTGVALKPAPLVYDPKRVANAMLNLAQHPKNSTTTDLAAPFFRLAYTLFPGLTRRVIASVMETYFQHAEPIANTSGNLLSPVTYGTSIYGGWRNKLVRKKTIPGALVVASVAAGLFLLINRK